jgi:hypothetical protein
VLCTAIHTTMQALQNVNTMQCALSDSDTSKPAAVSADQMCRSDVHQTAVAATTQLQGAAQQSGVPAHQVLLCAAATMTRVLPLICPQPWQCTLS